MTVQGSKRLFDAVRAIKGAALSQADVDAINAALAEPKPTIADPLPVNPRFPMEVIIGAIETEKAYPIPASVTLAQWALESGWGKSVSGKNNYGGITAKVKDAVFPFKPGTPLEPATLVWTHEIVGGKRVRCQRWFKDFDSPGAYFQAHAKLLGTSAVYARARAKYPDAEAFVEQLEPVYGAGGKVVQPGYATDPNYSETLKSIMRTNKLHLYDGAAR